MESLRKQFRPEFEGMSVQDAIDRWEYASALGDTNTAAKAQRDKAQAQLDVDYAVPHEDLVDVSGPADPVRVYAQEISALRGEVRALRADVVNTPSRKRKRRPASAQAPLSRKQKLRDVAHRLTGHHGARGR